MELALQQARQAAQQGEVPVGAVVTYGGHLVAVAHNQPIRRRDPSAHAELLALRKAARKSGNYRLPGRVLYCSLEPCPMCAMAIIHARIERVVYAARDRMGGADGSVFELLQAPLHNHRPLVENGLMADTSAQLLRQFFALRRGRRPVQSLSRMTHQIEDQKDRG